MPARGPIAVALVSGALMVAGCGSSSKPSAAGSSTAATLVRFSACVRSHGVPDFPDPSTTQGPNALGIDGYNFNLPANLNSESPAYVSAQKVCSDMLDGGGGTAQGIPAKAKEAALAHAECMRQHGVPNFPDPSFSGNGDDPDGRRARYEPTVTGLPGSSEGLRTEIAAPIAAQIRFPR